MSVYSSRVIKLLYVASKQYKNMLIADEVEEDLVAGSV